MIPPGATQKWGISPRVPIVPESRSVQPLGVLERLQSATIASPSQGSAATGGRCSRPQGICWARSAGTIFNSFCLSGYGIMREWTLSVSIETEARRCIRNNDLVCA